MIAGLALLCPTTVCSGFKGERKGLLEKDPVEVLLV